MSASFVHGHPYWEHDADRKPVQADALLASWREQGPAFLKRLRGDFALALHDGDQVLAAVDRFAVHSLCVRSGDAGLQVAPRADALAAADAAVQSQALFDYLYFHCIPSTRTVFDAVQRVPAGHYALWRQGQLRLEAYWTPRFQPAKGRPDFGALKTEFRRLLERAVASRLDGGTPACFLSGGTDSSTVAGLIGQVSGKKAHSYSIGFEAEGYDEMEFARIAAKHFDLEHHEYYVTPDDLVAAIPMVAASYDQPFGNSSVLPAYYCALKAKQDGVGRMLAGDGGDELFGGNTRYAKERVFGWWEDSPAALRSLLLKPLFDNPVVGATPLLKKGRSYIRQAEVPLPDRLQTYNLIERLGLKDVLEPAFLDRIDTQGPIGHQREVWRQSETDSTLNRMLGYDWRYTLGESDLPKVNGATQLAGVEVAYPMLDDALLDFSLTLPVHYKLKGLKLRWFFKEALRDFLPPEIITKKKQGFGLPFGPWLLRNPRLMALAKDSLESLAPRGMVRPDFIRALLNDRLPEHPGYYGSMVWILMMMEQWLRAHRPDWKVD